MRLRDKLRILADAAKYDASCSSSGGRKRDSVATRGIGSNEGVALHAQRLTHLRARRHPPNTRRPSDARNVHPSALLRLPDEADKDAEFAHFVADLKAAKALAQAHASHSS